VSGEFPPGSTIKPVMAAAALQEGVINENTSILSAGGLKVGQWVFPDWKGGGHGYTNVRKAIAESVNTFFYYIGGGYESFNGLGIERIAKYFKLFLLGSVTGIDLPNEGNGFLPTPKWKEDTKKEKWYIGDTYHVSIGQGDVTVTPLEVNNYTTFFANRGKIYRPYVVQRIMDENNQTIKETQPEILGEKFISQANIEVVRQGMRQTVTAGSAQSLKTTVVPVAGKTGTAQWSSIHANQAWFTGFAPYDNPQIAITVLVEEGGEGTTAAVPIVHDIVDWYFTNKASSTAAVK
jgi:penicillin-binding protein 2